MNGNPAKLPRVTTTVVEGAPRPAYPIESVDSALRLLQMFLSTDRVRLTEAAEMLGVSPSTAHRLLAMLCYHGFVMQDRQRREYRIGAVLNRLGLAALRQFDLREAARPIMEALSTKLNETVGLGILEGANVLYVAGIDGTQVIRVSARIGMLIPAHALAMGKMMLSALDDAQIDLRYPHEDLELLTARTVATKSALRAQLAVIRRRGYAHTIGESDEGVSSIAVAVRDGAGHTRGAMSIAAPFFRVSKSDISTWLPDLRRAAEQLGACLA